MTKLKDYLAGLGLLGTPAAADRQYWYDASGNVSKAETFADQEARIAGQYAPKANPTFTGNVVVPNADADTEALNRITADGRYLTAATAATDFISQADALVVAPAVDGNTTPLYYRQFGVVYPTGVAIANSRTYISLIVLPPGEIVSLSYNIVSESAGAGSWARAAIYEINSKTGVIGALVAAGDNVDATTTGDKSSTLGAPVEIGGGLYVAALSTTLTSGSCVVAALDPTTPLALGLVGHCFTVGRGSQATLTAPVTAANPFANTLIYADTYVPIVAVGMRTTA